MSRRFIDCREYPGDIKCTIALSADTDDELLEAAVQHAVTVHGMEDSPELRRELRTMFKNGTPPVSAPPPAATA
jgi:predicted small metal-binding protein